MTRAELTAPAARGDVRERLDGTSEKKTERITAPRAKNRSPSLLALDMPSHEK